MNRVVALLFACVLASPITARASGAVAFGILDGRISLIANNATPAEILAAWSAIGKTRIVNIERLATTRITMELLDVSELEALDILLRSAVGYVAVPRASFDEHLSRFDRIAIMPIKGAVAAPETRQMMADPQSSRFIRQPAEMEAIAEDDRIVSEPIDPENVEEPPSHPNGAPTFNAYPLQRPDPSPSFAPPETPPADLQMESRPSAPMNLPSPPDGGTAARPGVIVQPPTSPQRPPGQ